MYSTHFLRLIFNKTVDYLTLLTEVRAHCKRRLLIEKLTTRIKYRVFDFPSRVVYSPVLRHVRSWDQTPNQCLCKHDLQVLGCKGSPAMLTSVQSVGVTPEVNLINPLHVSEDHTGEDARNRWIHPGFKTKGRHHQKYKIGYQWPHKMESCPINFVLKIDLLFMSFENKTAIVHIFLLENFLKI